MLQRPNCPRAPELNETSDDSPKEYKNVLMLCFAAMKVLFNWFHNVNHYYLHPRHSHDLQDQAWAVLKTNFYKQRTITWEDFLLLVQKCFSTIKPEIITQLFVFDWATWLRPWMRKLKHHRDWRAFSFSRHPTDPSSVMMKWKKSESSTEDFHGSEQHPDGIEILLEIPPGQPERIFPTKLNPKDLTDLRSTFGSMSAEQRSWWEELVATCELPNNEESAIPTDYFNYKRFDYDIWLAAHPYTPRQPTSYVHVLPPIEVDETTGIAAIGDRIIELFVNDMISVRNDDNTFFIGKIRKIVEPPHGEDATLSWFQIWYFERKDKEADIWNTHTKYQLIVLRNNPAATSIVSLNHCLTAKFKMTKTMCLRKETLQLIKATLVLDQNNNNTNNTNDSNPTNNNSQNNTFDENNNNNNTNQNNDSLDDNDNTINNTNYSNNTNIDKDSENTNINTSDENSNDDNNNNNTELESSDEDLIDNRISKNKVYFLSFIQI